MGTLGDIWGPLWDARGSGGENFSLEKFFPKIYISEKYFSRFFGKTFSARVMARWGHLGIFGGPWGR